VVTSGNLSEECLAIDENEVLERLAGIADYFLVHNRPIRRHVDDSIVRMMHGVPTLLRRARGYVPLSIPLKAELSPRLGTGGHLKNAIALARGNEVFPGQHIGDLSTVQSCETHVQNLESFCEILQITPDKVYCDLHPDYFSTRHAQTHFLDVTPVQHHLAHLLACLAENPVSDTPLLGVVWDGTGFGPDGMIWGGEFFLVNNHTIRHTARFRPFTLPGGDQAAREPRRSALGLLHSACGHELNGPFSDIILNAFNELEWKSFLTLLDKGNYFTKTTSVGRLFDAVSFLCGFPESRQFEGQAGMFLEFLAGKGDNDVHYPVRIDELTTDTSKGTTGPSAVSTVPPTGAMPSYQVDWEVMLRALLDDLRSSISTADCARKFHSYLAEVVWEMVKTFSVKQVALSGGCFQNRLLVELVCERLEKNGITVYRHQQIPPNDGGLAVGQLLADQYQWMEF
jgi:hydrogenase maturation protein HypF